MDDLKLTFDIRPRWNSYIEFYGNASFGSDDMARVPSV